MFGESQFGCSPITIKTSPPETFIPHISRCAGVGPCPFFRVSNSAATMSHRQLHGWILLPLVICAVACTLLVNHALQLAEGSAFPAFGFRPWIRLCTARLPGRLRWSLAPFGMDLRSRYQSSGEPESRGIIPRNRASVIRKSSCRRRRYRSAASSDSAATQCISEA
jgi:hypothetical protein